MSDRTAARPRWWLLLMLLGCLGGPFVFLLLIGLLIGMREHRVPSRQRGR